MPCPLAGVEPNWDPLKSEPGPDGGLEMPQSAAVAVVLSASESGRAAGEGALPVKAQQATGPGRPAAGQGVPGSSGQVLSQLQAACMRRHSSTLLLIHK